ncbi:probable alpha-ketoglutarate-dependent hypophosphite dioxygenase [Montipora foliosa]|uniref:probable alpha-ketoglutarate-dependent hypophosphite dioxygenase n=1 Tax=Montipora foliosa TaxID=591990 RepID=UPI0035F14ED3
MSRFYNNMATVRLFEKFYCKSLKWAASPRFLSRHSTNTSSFLFKLDEREKGQYEENGFLVVKDILTEDEKKELTQATDELIEMSTRKTKSDKYFIFSEGHSSSKSLLKRSRIICPSLIHPVWHKALRHPKLLDIISQLVDSPSIRYIMQEKIHMKLPGEDGSGGIKWHQDWAFLPHTNDSIVTVGLAVDDSTVENGCLQVVPGTHKQPLFSHFQDGVFVSAINDTNFNPRNAVDIEVPAGGASFHHVRTAHASRPNNSSRSRRVCFTQYCAADSWPLIGVVGPEGYGVEGPVDWARFCSTIVRGTPTLFPRMVNIPISLPFPYERGYDVFNDNSHEEGITKKADIN